jgi:sirohydrochlorin cobaltochelatase
LSGTITQALVEWLAAGGNRIGELVILRRYELRHYMDATLDGMTEYTTPEAAREIALYDAAGNYRPLKTAPTLRRGWRLTLPDVKQVHAALDAFYPAMLAARVASHQGRLAITPLRDTLNRQSGMYAVTRKITDSQADSMIGSFCRTDGGCLKTILWQIGPGRPVTSLPPEKREPADDGRRMPLLCAEACNLLVARAREVVKHPASNLP